MSIPSGRQISKYSNQIVVCAVVHILKGRDSVIDFRVKFFTGLGGYN